MASKPEIRPDPDIVWYLLVWLVLMVLSYQFTVWQAKGSVFEDAFVEMGLIK